MRLVCLHDRDVIESDLRRDAELDRCELDAQDDFFRPSTGSGSRG